MKKVYDKCYGIDVHKKLMAAWFIHGTGQEVHEFGAAIRKLLKFYSNDVAAFDVMHSAVSL